MVKEIRRAAVYPTVKTPSLIKLRHRSLTKKTDFDMIVGIVLIEMEISMVLESNCLGVLMLTQ